MVLTKFGIKLEPSIVDSGSDLSTIQIWFGFKRMISNKYTFFDNSEKIKWYNMLGQNFFAFYSGKLFRNFFQCNESLKEMFL